MEMLSIIKGEKKKISQYFVDQPPAPIEKKRLWLCEKFFKTLLLKKIGDSKLLLLRYLCCNTDPCTSGLRYFDYVILTTVDTYACQTDC